MNRLSSAWRANLPSPAAVAAAAAVLLSACGGGGGGGATDTAGTAATGGTAKALAIRATNAAADVPATRAEAARFLTQSTFGPTPAAIDELMTLGYSAWIDRQFTLPGTSHRAYWEAADAAIKLANPAASAGQDQVWESFWKQAATGENQLRQRVAFALSEIFVISALDGNVGGQPRALAAWLDMLGDKGFGNYRDLLESVSLHPLMGFYLSHIRNQKPDTATGRNSDQNYAREVMQLFSIGVLKLNPDGTPQIVNGRTVDTYGGPDIVGLSWVFTGFSYACPAAPNANCFFNGSSGGVSDADRFFKPMVAYPQYHSLDAKTFLGVTIPASTATAANQLNDLKVALDTLAGHSNVGPFIGKQLIQRLVTSNPSPTYVSDIAAVWNNNGAGVRGDLKAVVKAILTHPQALAPTVNGGKVREPVLRLSAYLRAYPHASDSGSWKVGNTDSVSGSLGQTPLRAGSVFNFFRPGYVPPGTQAAAAGLVAPEMQLLNESSVSGWVNYMRDNLSNGVGQSGTVTINGTAVNRRDLQRDWSAERALATDPAALVASVTDKLLWGRASTQLTSEIVTAVGKITIPVLNAGGTNQAAIDTAKQNRVKAAILLVLASPEFLAQK